MLNVNQSNQTTAKSAASCDGVSQSPRCHSVVYLLLTFKNSDLVRTRAYHLMFCSSVVEIIARSKGT